MPKVAFHQVIPKIIPKEKINSLLLSNQIYPILK
ncbi:hypothetical protein HPPN135_08130 [Helicobacter pylori Puno135]|nr:hypothetical protein HPPN135_08130 [Helicobacter pylori Puno135]